MIQLSKKYGELSGDSKELYECMLAVNVNQNKEDYEGLVKSLIELKTLTEKQKKKKHDTLNEQASVDLQINDAKRQIENVITDIA